MKVFSGDITKYLYFVALDVTDLKTRETGLTDFTANRSRNGVAEAAMTTPTVTEIGNGKYALLMDEDMTIGSGNDAEEMVFDISHASMADVTRTITLERSKITLGSTSTAQSGDSFTRIGANGAGLTTRMAEASINTTGGKVDGVALVDVTTTNTDQRGTDDALLAASAPTNFGDLAITLTTGLMSVGTNNDKTDYSISGTITTLDGLNNFNPATDAVAVVTDLTNLPSITANWLTAAGIDASALNGKGDWNIGKTGYSLTQSFPTNFADMSITVTTGLVDMTQAAADKIWSSAARSLTDKLGFAVSATGLDLVTNTSTFALAVVNAIWTDKLTTYVDGEAGARLRKLTDLAGIEVTIDDASATTSSFITDQLGISLEDTTLKFLDGANAEQSKVITTHNTTTGEMTFDEPFDNAPADEDNAITGLHTHSITQIKEQVRAEMDANSTKLISILAGVVSNNDFLTIIDAIVDLILEDTSTTIPALIEALPTAAENTTAFFAGGDIDGWNLEQFLRVGGAALAGIASGGGTATMTYKGVNSSLKSRIIADVDGDGNRTAITYDLSA